MRRHSSRCVCSPISAKVISRWACTSIMEGDYDSALRELRLAAEALPNDGDVGLYIAAIERRRGHLKQALAAYQHAEQIDPRNSVMLYDASQTYFGLRDWRTAAERMDRVLALFPDSFNVKIQRAYIEFFWKGSTAPIKAALETLPPNLDPDGVVTFARWDMSLMNRDVVAAEKALAACQLDTIASQTGVPLPKSYLQGLCRCRSWRCGESAGRVRGGSAINRKNGCRQSARRHAARTARITLCIPGSQGGRTAGRATGDGAQADRA